MACRNDWKSAMPISTGATGKETILRYTPSKFNFGAGPRSSNRGTISTSDQLLNCRSYAEPERVRQPAWKPMAENKVHEFSPGRGRPFHLPLIVNTGNVVFRNASGRAILQDFTHDEVAGGVLRELLVVSNLRRKVAAPERQTEMRRQQFSVEFQGIHA